MLEMLKIKNYALIDNLSLSFNSGFNSITGETGAGKSILIGALGLVLGKRADKNDVRTGSDSCIVEAVFVLPEDSDIGSVLEEAGLDSSESQIIIRRIVSVTGGGRCFINDQPVTLQTLKSVGDLLVDMHGAHDHQSLLSQDFQLEVLDDFADLEKPKNAYYAVYRKYRDALRELDLINESGNISETEIELLEYQIQEIADADISEDDELDVIKEHKLLGNSRRLVELTSSILDALTENDFSASNQMGIVQKSLDELARLAEDGNNWKIEAQSIATQLRELSSEMVSFATSLEGDPNRLAFLDERIATYHNLKRKYGGSTESVLEVYNKLKARLELASGREEKIAELRKLIESIKSDLVEAAKKLTAKRHAAADKLAKLVATELGELAFQKSDFCVVFEETEPTPHGMDTIEFVFAPNKGEPPRDLRAVASSGEISRVMLALKSVLAETDKIPVLVFDEIDVNIGGRTGSAVGLKLAKLSRARQAICNTHLPQVAALEDSHYTVTKETVYNRTSSAINNVTGQDPEIAIAQILG
ncbi:MAG: DNA repair protein RecN, partial [Lentisphaerae bacterium]|nr:DNA repair protein RecN [Lentisphaerota bacterium]